MSFFLIIKKEIQILAKIIIPIFIIMILSFAIIIQILTISLSIKSNFLEHISYATIRTINEGYTTLDEFNDQHVEVALTAFYPETSIDLDNNIKINNFHFATNTVNIELDDDWIWYLSNNGTYRFSNKNDPNYNDIPDKNSYATTGSIGRIGRVIKFNPYFVNDIYKKGVISYLDFPKNSVLPKNTIILSNELYNLLGVKTGETININLLDQTINLTVLGHYSSTYSLSDYIISSDSFSEFGLENYVLTYNIYELSDYNTVLLNLQNHNYTSVVPDLSYESTMSLVNTIFTILVFLAIIMTIILTITIYSFLSAIINRRKQFLYQMKLIGFPNKKLIICYGSLLMFLIICSILIGILISSISLSFIGDYFTSLFDYEFVYLNRFLSPFIIFIFFSIVSFLLLIFTLNTQTSKTAVEKIRGAEKC